MAIGIKENPQSAGRSEKSDSVFPEPKHTKHQPGGKAAGSSEHFTSRSENVGRGHEDFDRRHPHLFRDRFEPNSETGEGQDNQMDQTGAGLLPEFK